MIRFEDIQEKVEAYMPAADLDLLRKAYVFSAKEHKGHGPAMTKEKKADTKKAAKAGKKYTCAMKCVEADKPGKCPKCGMNLVKVP